MKLSLNTFCALAFALFASCSNNDDPEYPIFMQPSAITTTNAYGDNQAFEYDDYGRVVGWHLKSNNSNDETAYDAQYSYTDNNTIHIVSEESSNENKRYYDETIQLINGRASKSEGTFISYVGGKPESRKTYRLEFEYDASNHLTVIKHSEVVGIGDEIKESAWNKPWAWENYLIWEGNNLKEFQDCIGKTSVYWTTKYDYSIEASDYPVIIPMVINNTHHVPLCMQGFFGLNSVNLVKSFTVTDYKGNVSFECQYTYKFEQARIVEYTQTSSYNTAYSNTITYNVNWIDRFRFSD